MKDFAAMWVRSTMYIAFNWNFSFYMLAGPKHLPIFKLMYSNHLTNDVNDKGVMSDQNNAKNKGLRFYELWGMAQDSQKLTWVEKNL